MVPADAANVADAFQRLLLAALHDTNACYVCNIYNYFTYTYSRVQQMPTIRPSEHRRRRRRGGRVFGMSGTNLYNEILCGCLLQVLQ